MGKKRNSVLRHSRRADFACSALLFIVSLLGYGHFLVNVPIHDFYNFFFPYRYFVTDAISQGVSPFWNPYESMGLSAHADPQSGVFYLPVWLFALIFGKYTTVCCAIEYIFHSFVGGAGFYFLAKHFAKYRFADFRDGGILPAFGIFRRKRPAPLVDNIGGLAAVGALVFRRADGASLAASNAAVSSSLFADADRWLSGICVRAGLRACGDIHTSPR